jgi:tetratricopeptide (TPR) repeat protein
MNRAQWISIFSAVALFAMLYFGFSTTPGKHKNIEKQRALAAVSTDINSLLTDAKQGMPAQQSASILALESELNSLGTDSAKAEVYKRLSSLWYSYEKPAIAGFYAEKTAELIGGEEAWSIAGTTYSICLQKEQAGKVKAFCSQKAVQCLENAASINPGNPQHKINLALVYAEDPPQDNPMKGVLMLIELNKQYPENVPLLTQLGRLAIKTGQFDKAVQRLEQALSLEPENPSANCLIVKAYEGAGNEPKAAEFRPKCDKLTNR